MLFPRWNACRVLGCLAFVGLNCSLALAETNLTMLSTGSGSALTRRRLSIEVPSNLPAASLAFDLGFATDETAASADFYDALSLTLRSADRSATDLLLTADLFGVTWSPLDPLGQGSTNVLAYGTAAVPDLAKPFLLRFAYAVAVEIPQFLLGKPGELLVSLFDNLDDQASLGWISKVSLGPSLKAAIALESSAVPGGPFAEEAGTHLDRIRRTLELPGGGASRFYRLRSSLPCRVISMDAAGDNLVFRYDTPEPELRLELQSASQPAGPYERLAGARFDMTNHTVRVARAIAGDILRLQGNVQAAITSSRVEGLDLVLSFEVSLPIPILESSAQADGPFAQEMGVATDARQRELRIPGRSAGRFYRLRSDIPLVIRRVEQVGAHRIFHYELP